MRIADRALEEHAFRLCQELLRIDTTNPPGNERPAADVVAREFKAAGLEPIVLESAPTRGNVVARLKGNGKKRPLLLTGHLDVVEHEPGKWKHPAFAGEVHEGCLWGRGALDMKNFVAMSVAIMTRLAREGAVPDRGHHLRRRGGRGGGLQDGLALALREPSRARGRRVRHRRRRRLPTSASRASATSPCRSPRRACAG